MSKKKNQKRFTLPKKTCMRCGHKWVIRKRDTKVCPKCKSPYWNTPRQSETVATTEAQV